VSNGPRSYMPGMRPPIEETSAQDATEPPSPINATIRPYRGPADHDQGEDRAEIQHVPQQKVPCLTSLWMPRSSWSISPSIGMKRPQSGESARWREGGRARPVIGPVDRLRSPWGPPPPTCCRRWSRILFERLYQAGVRESLLLLNPLLSHSPDDTGVRLGRRRCRGGSGEAPRGGGGWADCEGPELNFIFMADQVRDRGMGRGWSRRAGIDGPE
jgi:hypothetical protein